MYKIVAHAKPNKSNENFEKILGAFVVCLIDFKEIDGAFALARFYIEYEDWEVIEFDEEYFIINSIDDLTDEYKGYYEEVNEFGYSMVFNTYDNIDE